MIAAEMGGNKDERLQILNFLVKIENEQQKIREFINSNREPAVDKFEKEKKINGLYMTVFKKLGIKYPKDQKSSTADGCFF